MTATRSCFLVDPDPLVAIGILYRVKKSERVEGQAEVRWDAHIWGDHDLYTVRLIRQENSSLMETAGARQLPARIY